MKRKVYESQKAFAGEKKSWWRNLNGELPDALQDAQQGKGKQVRMFRRSEASAPTLMHAQQGEEKQVETEGCSDALKSL